MKHLFDRLKLKDEYDHIAYLNQGHFWVILLSLVYRFYSGDLGFVAFFYAAFLFFFYKMYGKTLENLYYTFWTFSLIVFLYLFHGVWTQLLSFNDFGLGCLYLLGLFILVIQLHIISSPIFYPRVSWWEYDFRYKADLKVFIDFDQEEFPGRLTDLRRGAGCVVSFEDITIGESIKLRSMSKDLEGELTGFVMSKRESTPGRGMTYGIKFNLDNPEYVECYKNFSKEWKKRKVIRKRMKFKKV